MKQNKLLIVVTTLLIFAIFGRWFFSLSTLSSGDWPFFYQSAISRFPLQVAYYKGYWGLGSINVLFASLETYFQITSRLFYFLPWPVLERLFWFFPFLILCIFSSFKLTRSIIGSLIYTTNTYILMVLAGGQLGVALAYAVAPFVLKTFIDLIVLSSIEKSKIKNQTSKISRSFIAGLVLALQVLFDPRIAFLISLTTLAYFVFYSLQNRVNILKRFIVSILIPFFLALLLHSFWIFPILFMGVGPSDHGNPSIFSQGAVRFFSFSDYSHALTLLHPNWPENIFGKVSFMQPEFIILPILAFIPLLFLKKYTSSEIDDVQSKRIIFFSLLGIIGAFLAKGASEPFGSLYLWLFSNIPGFVVFRDPTKFYLFTALAFSFLIPFSLEGIGNFLKKLKVLSITSRKIEVIIFLLFVGVWGLLIRDSVFGRIEGTFNPDLVPKEYISFANFIDHEKSFSRVLWIPSHQRFGYYSNLHPAISATEFFQTSSPSALLGKLKDPKTQQILRESAVKYIVVPSDPKGEIFLLDRKYSGSLHTFYLSQIKTVPGLFPVSRFGDITVYKLPNSFSHFWIPDNKDSIISVTTSSPTDYLVHIEGARKGDTVVFSETYSRLWRVEDGGVVTPTSQYKKLFNSYQLSRGGVITLHFTNILDKGVFIGSIISIFSFFSVMTLLIYSTFKKKL